MQSVLESSPEVLECFSNSIHSVDDIPERFGVMHNGIRLLVMGRIKTGYYCPENAFTKELVRHLLLEEKDVVIMDMEAGIEHLGRGTAIIFV